MSLNKEGDRSALKVQVGSEIQRDLSRATCKAERLLAESIDTGDSGLFDAGNQILEWVGTGEPVSTKTVQTAFKRGLISGLDRDRLLREIEGRSDHPDLDQVISDN